MASTTASFCLRLVQPLGSVGTTARAYLWVPIGVGSEMVFLGESLAPSAWMGRACVVVWVGAMVMPGKSKTLKCQ